MIKDREVFVNLNNIILDLDRINPGGDKIHAFSTRRANIRWFLKMLERDLEEGKIDGKITFDQAQENYPKKIFFELAWLLNNSDLKI